MHEPSLFTFDIFGTVIDWRLGLRQALAPHGVTLSDADFDRVIDAQGEEEAGLFRPYAAFVASSLVSVLGVPRGTAEAIGAGAGAWPPYPDAAGALRRLMDFAPCVAMTNSDRAHGARAQAGLGLRLDGWICAEDVRAYKPSPRFWREVSERRGISAGPHWWHVSAYADYDLGTARSLGLTCVYVDRPHARPGPAELTVADLARLADTVEAMPRPRR